MDNENIIKASHDINLLLQDLREIYSHSKNEALVVLAFDMIKSIAEIEAKLLTLQLACKSKGETK